MPRMSEAGNSLGEIFFKRKKKKEKKKKETGKGEGSAKNITHWQTVSLAFRLHMHPFGQVASSSHGI